MCIIAEGKNVKGEAPCPHCMEVLCPRAVRVEKWRGKKTAPRSGSLTAPTLFSPSHSTSYACWRMEGMLGLSCAKPPPPHTHTKRGELHEHACSQVCMHVEVKGGCWICFLLVLHLIPWGRILCFLARLAANNFTCPPIFLSSVLRAQTCPDPTSLVPWMLRFKLQSSRLGNMCFHMPSHSSSLHSCISKNN